MALYEEFLHVVTEPSLTCVRFLGSLLGQQREEYAKTVLNIFVAHNRDVDGVKTLTRCEIESTGKVFTLLAPVLHLSFVPVYLVD